MPSNSVIQIDPNKLSEELKKRNLNAVEVSRKIGYNDHYISQAIVRGRISKPGVVGLKNFYNIERSDYERVTEPEPQTPEPSPVPSDGVIDYDRLGNIIFNAVYSAVKKAWAE